MALTKMLQVFGTTGKTVYCVVRRLSDGYFLQAAKTSFGAGVAYLAMVEDDIVKGLYSLATNDMVWPDAVYVVAVYQQAGVDPSPSVDTLIGGDVPKVVSDTLVQLDGSLAAVAAQLGVIQADLETPVPGSTIPRVQMLDRLYIAPGSDPVHVQPANTDDSIQYLHFYGVNGDNTPAVGKVAAVPAQGQHLAASLVSKQRLEAELDDTGYGHLVLIPGVVYRVSAPWWDAPITLTATADLDRNIVQYL